MVLSYVHTYMRHACMYTYERSKGRTPYIYIYTYIYFVYIYNMLNTI